MNLHDSISRRDALARVAASGVAAAGLSVHAAAGADSSPHSAGWIDAHAHIWTRDIKKYPLAKTATLDDLKPASFTAEQLLQTARPVGVTRVILIQHHPLVGYDNSYLVDVAEKYPETFRVVGQIDDQKPHPDRTMRDLATKRVSGFRITLLTRTAEWLDGPGMNAMWRTAADTGQAICCLTNPSYLESIDKMCTKHPETNVVIDHFARIGVDGVIREQEVAALCRLAKQRNTYVKLSAFYALGQKQPPYDDMIPMIEQLFEAFGPQRLMWASDSPYQMQGGNSYRDSIQLIHQRIKFFSEDDKQQVLSKTAERVYFGNLSA